MRARVLGVAATATVFILITISAVLSNSFISVSQAGGYSLLVGNVLRGEQLDHHRELSGVIEVSPSGCLQIQESSSSRTYNLFAPNGSRVAGDGSISVGGSPSVHQGDHVVLTGGEASLDEDQYPSKMPSDCRSVVPFFFWDLGRVS